MQSDRLPGFVVVLLVDDDRATREMYSAYLTSSGLTVLPAADGVSALKLVNGSRAPTPDVVVTDLGMPGMDGVHLTRQLRRDPRFRHVPIIAISGQTLPARVSDVRDAGADTVLLKPCLPDALLGSVRALLEGRARGPADVARRSGRGRTQPIKAG